MNLDEELMLASVVTMKTRGVIPWVSFDTTTIGPISSWFLHGVSALAGMLDYQRVHVLAAAMWAAMGMICVLLVFLLTSRRGAIVSFFIVSVTFFVTLKPDYLHFNSEILPSLFLSLGVLSLTLVRGRNVGTVKSCLLVALCGFLCSTSMLGKLQAAPVAMFVFSGALLLCLAGSKKQRMLSVLSLLLGFSALPLFLTSWMVVIGESGTAWDAYFSTALSYGKTQSWNSSRISHLGLDVWNGWGFWRPFLIMSILVLILFPSTRPANLEPERRIEWAFLFGWLLASLCAVAMPAKRWEHHGTFLVAPSVVFLSYLIAMAARGGIPEWQRWKSRTTSIALFLVWLGFCFPHLRSLDLERLSVTTDTKHWQQALFQKIAREADGRPVAVWGWAPSLFAEMNLPSSTRHMISHFLIDESPARENLRKAYMKDLRENPPAVFLDAVCQGFFLWSWSDYPKRRAESFPELQDFLNKHYDKQITKPYPAHVYTLKKQN